MTNCARALRTFLTIKASVIQYLFEVESFKNMIPPGLEPGTFRVLGERDNHYITETDGERREIMDCIRLSLHTLQ